MRNDVVIVIIIKLKIHPLPSIFQLLVRSASVGLHLPARTFSETVEVFRVGKQFGAEVERITGLSLPAMILETFSLEVANREAVSKHLPAFLLTEKIVRA